MYTKKKSDIVEKKHDVFAFNDADDDDGDEDNEKQVRVLRHFLFRGI